MSHQEIAFIGCGRVATALARAFAHHGLRVTRVASRSAGARQLADSLPACRAVPADQAASADLVFITVADDAIASMAAALPWRPGQIVVHCSGATALTALQPAADAGAWTAGFHPLQIFTDPTVAEANLPGSYVAIEGPETASTCLEDIARRLGMRPLHLPPGARALYHGGASFAASFLLSMLDEVAQIWQGFGIAPQDTLQALLPLARGTLDAAQARGLSGAIAGPLSRGDRGVVAAHLAALDALGGEHGILYRQFAQRQLDLLAQGDRLSEEQITALRALCTAP